MAVETRVQWFVHFFEQGKAAIWLRRLLVVIVFVSAGMFWLLVKFGGFDNADAMDQAQIARQLSTGQGYTTLYARPLAMNLMLARTGRLPTPLPEVSQAPLGPIINAVAFRLTRLPSGQPMQGVVFPAERLVAFLGFCFFGGSLLLTYLLGRRLFDPRIALFATGLAAVTQLLWRFSFSGLPQMAMLLLFTGCMLATVTALEARAAQHPRRAIAFLTLGGFTLGLTALGNGLGIWMFAGFLAFAVTAFRPRLLAAAAPTAAFALPLLPWALRNWLALRNPMGLPFFELYRPSGTDRLALLADFEPLLRFRWTDFSANTMRQALEQFGDLFSLFGGNPVTLAFFPAVLLLPFAKWQPAQFRWCILLMWLAAAAGMSVFGVGGSVSVNQLHVLFLPVMTIYGLAFLLNLWSRLGFDLPVLRAAFLALLFVLVGAPLALSFLSNPKRMNWPPYIPPLIEHFSAWIGPDEAMSADIPWATAWYANRSSLLLPRNTGQFDLINSERLLGAPLVALYLTPFSGDRAAFRDIVGGPYRDWARFILREVRPEDLRGWTLKAAAALPMNGDSIIYADRPRWQ